MAGQKDPEVAIVTGGSAGIGLAIARALAASGRHVVITGRDRARLASATDTIARDTRATVEARAIDASDYAAMTALVRDTAAKHGRLDILVNNAGVGNIIPIPQTTEAELDRIFRANLFGPAGAIAGAWATFAGQRRGCIVNISSWAALDPFPGFFIYGATKSALNSLARSAWNEGKDLGIRPFTIGPGAVETDLLRSAIGEDLIPREACLSPQHIADLAMECIEGRREDALGRCLYIRRDPDTHKVSVELEPSGPERDR